LYRGARFSKRKPVALPIPTKARIMRITIDSSESLDDALRVIGAMYGVTLTVATPGTADAAPTTQSTATSGSPRPAKTRTRSSKSKGGAGSSKRTGRAAKVVEPSVDAAELRSWARAHGYTVSDRGRVPGAVAAAYREAHQN
jgi:hypothetical protein